MSVCMSECVYVCACVMYVCIAYVYCVYVCCMDVYECVVFCEYACMHVLYMHVMCGISVCGVWVPVNVRRQLAEVSSLLLPCWIWESN